MGLILDTGILIAAERRGFAIATILEQIQETWAETEIGMSAESIVEFAHGIERAKTEEQWKRRSTGFPKVG